MSNKKAKPVTAFDPEKEREYCEAFANSFEVNRSGMEVSPQDLADALQRERAKVRKEMVASLRSRGYFAAANAMAKRYGVSGVSDVSDAKAGGTDDK